MKRAFVVGTGTVMGVAAVLALNPDGSAGTIASAPSVSQSSGTSGSTGSTSGSSSSGSGTAAAPSGSASSSGTVTVAGSTVDVGRDYGTIQVEVTLTDGRIVDVTALAVPSNDPRSQQISQRAFPTLVQQAIEAQTSQIAGVSGASYTSQGFAESLRAALVSAGHAA